MVSRSGFALIMTMLPRASGSPDPEGAQDLLVDGHVHCHSCFDRDEFFDHAAANLGAAAGVRGSVARCLMLTESAGDHFFQDLLEEVGGVGQEGWSVRTTAEDESVLVSRTGDTTIVVVAGTQIVTRERLEVLALGSRAEFGSGLSLSEALSAVSASGAIPVIPWGFGKWWSARGRLVDALLRGPVVPRFFLGDNGGRPRIAPAPRLFQLAAERGVGVLPGSDPLPFPNQVCKVGGYGFALRGAFSPDRPAASVKRILAGLTRSPEPFGRRESVPGFLRAQIGMQWRLRSGIR